MILRRLNNGLNSLRIDPHVHEVAGATIMAFSLKVLGAGLAFGFNIAVARLLGAEGSGVYFLALSITAISSIVGRLGLDNSLLRFVAVHAANEEWGMVKGVYVLAVRMVILAAGLITFTILFAASWLAIDVFHKPELVEPLRWMSLGIVPFALLNLHAEALKGLKHIRDAMLVQSIGLPLGSLLLIFPLSHLFDVSGAILAYVVAAMVTALVGLLAWRRAVVEYTESAPPFPFRRLWKSCKPLFIADLMKRALMPWAPIMLIGIWVDSKDVGIFGAATRVSMLVSLMLITFNNIVAPKFAELFARNEMEELGRLARRLAFLVTLIASPLFLALFFEADLVMSLFGPEFTVGADILMILLVGQLIGVVCGSVGYLLMMSGNESTYRNITIASALGQLLLILLLAPAMGSMGAALASSFALIGMNLSAVYAVKRKLGFITVPGLNFIIGRLDESKLENQK